MERRDHVLHHQFAEKSKGVPPEQPEKNNLPDAEERHFNNQVEFAEWRTRSSLDIYPSNHKLSQYAQNQLDRLHRDNELVSYKITVFRGPTDAFVFPNGSIYVSDGLLEMVDNEEEMLFVLQHEKNHAQEQHSKKQLLGKSNGLWESLGKPRFHEWEADIRAFDTLSELNINPVGGIEFLHKLRAEGDDLSGLAHGRETDRVLNLLSMTYVRDLPSLGAPMIPVPEAIKKVVVQEQSLNFDDSRGALLESENARKHEQRMRFVETAPFDYLLITYPQLLEQYRSLGKRSTESAALLEENQQELLTKVYIRLYEHVDKVTQQVSPPLSQQQKVFVLHGLLYMTAGANITMKDEHTLFAQTKKNYVSEKNGKRLEFSSGNFAFAEQLYSTEDVEDLLACLRPEIISAFHLKAGFSAKNFGQAVNKIILEREIFVDSSGTLDADGYLDFVKTFSSTLGALYDAQGTNKSQPAHFPRLLVEQAQNLLPKKQVEILLAEQEAGLLAEQGELRQETKIAQQLVNVVTNYKTWVEAHAKIAAKMNKSAVHDMRYRPQDFLGWVEDLGFHKTDPIMAEKYKSEINEAHEYQESMKQEINQILFQGNTADSLLVCKVVAEFLPLLLSKGLELETTAKRVSTQIQKLVEEHDFLDASLSRKVDRGLLMVKVAYLLDDDSASNYLDGAISSPDFSIDDFKKFHQFSIDPAGSLTKELGFDVSLEENEQTQLVRFAPTKFFSDTLERGLYNAVDNFLETKPDKKALQKMIEYVTTEFPYNHYGISAAEASGESYYQTMKPKVLNYILEHYSFDLNDADDLITLYYLSTHIEDTSLAVRLQKIVWEKLALKLDFQKGLGSLQKEIENRRLLSLEAFKSFAENRAESHDELEEIRRTVLLLLAHRSTTEGLGVLAIEQEAMDTLFPGKEKKQLLFALLGNNTDDSLLKEYLYKGWKRSYPVLSFVGKEELNLDSIMERMYRFDPQTKHLLVRELLTGQDGILTGKNPRAREELVNYYIDNFVAVDNAFEKDILDNMRLILQEMARTTPYHILYFALAPIIQERILQKPAQQITWDSLISKDDPETLAQYGASEEVLRSISGESENEEFVADEKERSAYSHKVEAILSTVEEKPVEAKQNVSQFILEIAGRLGAPGIRFLQLLGQYIPLSPELAQIFRGAYDKVEGQPKFTAQHTLLREWPDARQELAGLGSREGGGSLNSVFRVGDRVVKIRNPNALFHAETTFNLLKDVFTNLAKIKPEFKPTLQILDDIREWIRSDVGSENFIEDDKKFKDKHDGFSLGGRYKIKIPTSYPPENKYFQQEEYIKGTNLTKLDELEAQGHDTKKVVSLVAKNFLAQLSSGQVHSDLHPGNIRVTPNNEVALLDRSFYLHLEQADQMLLFQLAQSMNSPESAANVCCDYLVAQGGKITKTTRNKIAKEAKQLANLTSSTDKMLGLSIILRKYELKLPLKITLVIKNIFYLDRLAKAVGFADLQAAYQSSES